MLFKRAATLVTGSTGFIGSTLMSRLTMNGWHPIGASRSALRGTNDLLAPPLEANGDWTRHLKGIDVVVHTAGLARVVSGTLMDELNTLRAVNVTGTLNLAHQAAAAGARRFVFISSVKVNGQETRHAKPFAFADDPAPQDPYGISKAEAEAGLAAISAETGMEIVVIRPPLVYGPGVRSNFAAMMRAVQRGWPLPFGGVTTNSRSLVALDNLVDLIVTCVDHPAAANQTFMVSDGEDLSTADLLRRIGAAMGRPARLLNIPPALLDTAAKLLGKKEVAQRLLGNLQVDIAHTCNTLNWRPPVSVDEGLRRAVEGMRQ